MSNSTALKLQLTPNLFKRAKFKLTKPVDADSFYDAYQMGSFVQVHQLFSDRTMTKERFIAEFSSFCAITNVTPLTFFAIKDGVEIPIGFGLFWFRGRVIQVENLVWFPWASKRNIFESALLFYDVFRKCIEKISGRYYKVMEFAQEKDEPFFDRLVSLGVLTKIGKIDGLYPNGEQAVFYVTQEVGDA